MLYLSYFRCLYEGHGLSTETMRMNNIDIRDCPIEPLRHILPIKQVHLERFLRIYSKIRPDRTAMTSMSVSEVTSTVDQAKDFRLEYAFFKAGNLYLEIPVSERNVSCHEVNPNGIAGIFHCGKSCIMPLLTEEWCSVIRRFPMTENTGQVNAWSVFDLFSLQ